ncbi:hypothetical protein KUV65_01000 [Maritalea mobilis]|uniref:hypothetical protein n=1 Tax=Maritalea mobilis TaxID=483324 RepID=UPI001C95D332|nr:hypothetical protein [Maritalea mobilis]MBY6199927.1 hypothetical protein [Maritalea mobilis]
MGGQRTQARNQARSAPRHRRAAPRRVDLVGLGAPFEWRADLADIKRSRSTVGSTHRGPSMPLGAQLWDRVSLKKRNQRQQIDFFDERAGKNARPYHDRSRISRPEPFTFKLQLLQVHAEVSFENTFDTPSITYRGKLSCTHFSVSFARLKCLEIIT